MSHAIPKTALETLNEVVAGYNKIADIGEEITDEGVAEARDVSEDNARRQKSFLSETGVLKKDGHDYYLTEKGHELGKLIRFNQQEEAGGLYRELLDSWEPTEEILAHVDEGGLSLDDLADKIALVTANELTSNRKKRGAETIVELMRWAAFLSEEDGTYRISDDNEADKMGDSEALGVSSGSSSDVDQTAAPEEPQVTHDGGASEQESLVHTGGLDISLDISGSDDPKNVRRLLWAIRKGTQEDVDDYESFDENTE